MGNYIGNAWYDILEDALAEPSYVSLCGMLKEAYRTKTVYPSRGNVFAALKLTPPESVRAVILGQDPYINPGQAHGLSFSVPEGQDIPPSLRNIFKEREADLGLPPPAHGCLIDWARQGVLLLNTVLTVEAGRSQSHAGIGWERLTDSVISYLGSKKEPIVFILWGRHAQNKEKLIQSPPHLVLKAAHPSPLSANAGFFGSKPFSKCNEFLATHELAPICW